MAHEEFFGSEDQQALLRRGHHLSQLVKGDSRFCYYGRTVGLVTPGDGSVETLVALTKLQGSSNYASVPAAEAARLTHAVKAHGLTVVNYARWHGENGAIGAAKKVTAQFALPDDLVVHRLDGETPAEVMQSFADLALSCGVLPPSGKVLRGLADPATCLVAQDKAGRVVSCAGASSFVQPDHPELGGQAWWGMLATHPDRRGERLALILGALALLDMRDRFGICDFFTGVEPGNSASEAVCTRMGLTVDTAITLSCADPQSLKGGRMTK